MRPAHASSDTIRAHIEAAAARLRTAGLPPNDAAFDADLLARSVLRWDRADLVARAHEPPPPGFAVEYDALVARRADREPAAQVIGRREFWARDFEVTRDVLVPRPETELIVEAALDLHRTTPPRRVVDVGTGSGCLAVTLALEWPDADMTATDISEAALHVAARNAARHGVDGRIRFVRTSVLAGLPSGFDLIVANPPYVRSGDRPALSREVRDYEPAEALFGGEDGLDVVRTLLDQSADALGPGGHLLMEFGAGQDDQVTSLVEARPRLNLDRILADLSGIPRTAVVSRRP